MRLTKRLSDGQAVVDCENCERHEKGCTALYCRNRLKDALAQYEDADVVPVVRCRDCKYYDPEDWGGITCKADGGMTDPDEDSFCSQGERRTDNGKAVDEG